MNAISEKDLPWLAQLLLAADWPGRQRAYAAALASPAAPKSLPYADAAIIITGSALMEDTLRAARAASSHSRGAVQILAATSQEEGLPDLDLRLKLACATSWVCARNLAALCANAGVLIFLEAGFLPDPGLVDAYLDCLCHDTLAARGRARGQAAPLGAFFRSDLGMRDVPWALDRNENMAINAGIFYQLGGFDETMPPGAESLELSCRILELFPAADSQYYCALASGQDKSPNRNLSEAALDALNARFENSMTDCEKYWRRQLELHDQDLAK